MDYYAMRHKVTGKIYIGGSDDVIRRIKSHITALTYGKHTNKKLQSDCDKYGIDFDFFLLEQTDEHDRTCREKEWQAMFRSNDPKYGYNLHHSERQRRLDDYPKIYQQGFDLWVEERPCDRLYEVVVSACEVHGRDIEDVRKKANIGEIEIHNLIGVDGYVHGNALKRIADEIGIPLYELDEKKRHGAKRTRDKERRATYPPNYFRNLAIKHGRVTKEKQEEVRELARERGIGNIGVEIATGLCKSAASRWMNGYRNFKDGYVWAIEQYINELDAKKEVANESDS